MSNPDYINIGTPAMRIIEECGEILQVVGKGERFGWNNHHPERIETNIEELEKEMLDLMQAISDLKTFLATH